jgi:hypothetical protein
MNVWQSAPRKKLNKNNGEPSSGILNMNQIRNVAKKLPVLYLERSEGS